MKHIIEPAMLLALRKGVEKGYWTLEDLDTPSEGFKTATRVDRAVFKLGYEGVQHRNLLREEIQAHPETVQAQPDPRDFVPSAATAAQQLEPDPCPFQSMPFKQPKPKNVKNAHNWKPFIGKFKVIKLKRGEGLTTPMTEEQFINRRVSTTRNEDW